MSNEVYFSNHQSVMRFPWSLYHLPLQDSLESFLIENNDPSIRKKILVIGPGHFLELKILDKLNYDVSIVDIDERVLNHFKGHSGVKAIHHSVDGTLASLREEKFDLVYAKEVIEHIVKFNEYLANLFSVLNANGKVWISTPNYGFFLLPFLEKTFLELIARFKGFSRKNIHPSKFSKKELGHSLENAGFAVEKIKTTPGKLAIWAIAKRKT